MIFKGPPKNRMLIGSMYFVRKNKEINNNII